MHQRSLVLWLWLCIWIQQTMVANSPANLKSRGRFVAIDTFGAVDFVAADGSTLSPMRAWLCNPLRVSALKIVSFCTGIPISNLLYSSAGLESALPSNSKISECQVVTGSVYLPFSNHMLMQARVVLDKKEFGRAFQLAAAALFMRAMHYSGLVQVALYCIEFY